MRQLLGGIRIALLGTGLSACQWLAPQPQQQPVASEPAEPVMMARRHPGAEGTGMMMAAQRSPMDMPEWYRQILRGEIPEGATLADEPLPSVARRGAEYRTVVRGLW